MSGQSYSQLKSQLLSFMKVREFTLSSSGNYDPEDADWNYKDVPHLNIVHSQVDSIQAYIADKSIATINFQKVFGVSIPLAVFNFEVKKGEQVYFTTMGPFVLIIKTTYFKTKERTTVETTYAIGTKFPFTLLLPLVQKSIEKNYSILMSEDTPMRDRRGELRKHGHSFDFPGDTYSFDFTTRINLNNVRLTGETNSITVAKSELISGGSATFGATCGVLSFWKHRVKDGFQIWPTTCPHEGAELDSKNCANAKMVSCPWHGRKIIPACNLTEEGNITGKSSGPYLISESDSHITITYKPN